MNTTWLNNTLIIFTAFLAVFWAASFHGVRHLLGAQIDLLPPLMVYAALYSSLGMVASLAFVGGLWFDSLSANPLGVSIFPLFVVGLLIFASRELILRDQIFARLTLGFAASLLAPVICLLILLTTGRAPLFGWGTLWQLFVMAVGGAVATPVLFEIFGWLNRAFGHAAVQQSSFRPDREIRRGR